VVRSKFIKTSIFILISVFLLRCSVVDRLTRPTARSTSPESKGPTIEEAQKEDYMGPKARVAVTRFEDKSAKGKSTGAIGDGMAEMLSHALFATNRFIVLERGAIGDVIAEQDFGASDRVKPETAPRIGEIEGADLLIMGTITEFEPGSAGAGGGVGGLIPMPGGMGIGISTSHVAMIVKVIDAKTGRRLASEQVEGKATDIGGIIGGFGGPLAGVFAGFAKTPMEKAIRIAIEEAVKLIVNKTPKEYYRFWDHPSSKKPPEPIHEKPVTTPPPQTPPTPLQSPQSPQPPEQPLRTTQVTVSIENLREKPQGKIIGKVNKGTTLIILEEIEKWLRVRLEDGREAWIWKASTSVGSKTPSSSSKPTTPKVKSPM
jgi:curli biogenesis system outer membrane secretion channel CsgG